MFKKKLLYTVEASEVVNFCRILGKYGLKFKISQERRTLRKGDHDNRYLYYRVFAVWASSRQARILQDELNPNDESIFDP